ncbi:MAG: D-glycero-beta-D-manno-heptose-7-phosphate kinase [Bacteriovoracaceae bacterium]|nr:D-glycero-beta-D-manno-heptose-7-phosphate kinase [Bacteriovoracaceae bacterium]
MNIISQVRLSEIIGGFGQILPIMVVGDLGVDKYTYGTVNRISPEAPVPVLEVKEQWHQLGLAANVTNNLKAIGVQSTLCGVIGEDYNANIFNDLMLENDLDIQGVLQVSGRSTIFKERVTTKTQQICRVDYEMTSVVDSECQQRMLKHIGQFVDQHSALIIEDYGKGLITKELAGALAQKVHESEKIIAVDPSRTTHPMCYQGVDLLKPNWVEAQIMANKLGYHETNLETIAQILIEKLKLKMLTITLGGEGMALVDTRISSKLTIIPTVATEVFDVSGAGDTTISLIVASLVAGATLEEAVWIGNCGAGVVVGKKGTATVTTQELHQYHKQIAGKLNC